jgi:hypothetical protein
MVEYKLLKLLHVIHSTLVEQRISGAEAHIDSSQRPILDTVADTVTHKVWL